jgi:hypothetical protein
MNIRKSRWSDIDWYIEKPINYVLEFKVELHTRSLTLPHLSEKREKRLRLLSGLRDGGLSTQTISDLFNTLHIRTPRGSKYSTELVWGTISKWKKREQRLMDEYIHISSPVVQRIFEGD